MPTCTAAHGYSFSRNPDKRGHVSGASPIPLWTVQCGMGRIRHGAMIADENRPNR